MNKRHPQRRCDVLIRCGLLVVCVGGCAQIVPSQAMRNRIVLPVPKTASQVPSADRLTRKSHGEHYEVSPLSLVSLAFELQPDIKSSFQRFKSEEARYDFFYTSRDSSTPRLSVSNSAGESRADESVTRTRRHTVELALEKRFFDTTELEVGVGYDTDGLDEDISNRPFLSASLRYPLWASREKLERASEDIFRRNDLNDAQLGYIQEVRRRLRRALFRYYEVDDLGRRVAIQQRWLDDLEMLVRSIGDDTDRNATTDMQRVRAEIAKVSSEMRNTDGRYQIQFARLKGAIGLPFHAEMKLVDQEFNPFAEGTHESWLTISIETDPEIATLRNEVRNAEVQLDLARRGTWDISLLLDGRSNLEGRGEADGVSDWFASVGLNVSHVDSRVTDSLARQAQARIQRFRQAIAARENAIFVDTLEPFVRIDTLSASREQLAGNLPRYLKDYRTGLEDYKANRLNIDDLLKRRENVFDQEEEISRLTFLVGANVAELCAATGKFFEYLEEGQPD